MSAHEIVTIQCGHYANFVGTHWWNMQEASFCYTENVERPLDMNHDVLFREGLNRQGEVTFTPRLIAIDTKASLRSLKREGALYTAGVEEKEDLLWNGATTVIQKEPEEKNAFLRAFDKDCYQQSLMDEFCLDSLNGPKDLFNLDSTVSVWSDYLKTHLHPRSICLIDEHNVSGDESSFEAYDWGVDLYRKKATQDMIEDKLRQYVEECDYLQGFHVLVDGDNGFCGVSNNILQHMDEEYKKITKAVFPAFQKTSKLLSTCEELKALVQRLYSTVLGFNTFNTLSSFFSPLSLSVDIISSNGPHRQFHYLNYKPDLPYHTSAILAAALETLTAPYRLKARKFLLSDISDSIVLYGRKILSSGSCLPFVFQDSMHFTSPTGGVLEGYSLKPLTPCFDPHLHCSLAQSAVLRGVPIKRFSRMAAKSHLSVDTEKENYFGQYLNVYSPSSLTFVSIFDEACAVSTPFPSIFGDKYVQSSEDENAGFNSAPIAATLSNSNNASDILQQLLTETKKHITKIKTYSASSEFEADDFTEVIQNLVALKENYGPNYSV